MVAACATNNSIDAVPMAAVSPQVARSPPNKALVHDGRYAPAAHRRCWADQSSSSSLPSKGMQLTSRRPAAHLRDAEQI